MIGDQQTFNWCSHCGALYPIGMGHVCGTPSQTNYAPNLHPIRAGAQVVPVLTEADVRRIVREELERARQP